MEANGLVLTLPFIGMLLSLALGPVVCEKFWHKHYFKIALGWAAIGTIMLLGEWGGAHSVDLIMHTMLHEYLPFIILIGTLFAITGGIHVTMRGHATPFLNVLYLLFGGLAASFIGTTGAAMLLIRPFLQLNRLRRQKTYLVMFFIFIVANIGGCLTPLGDPPLFLGYLKGIDFSWSFINLSYPLFLVLIPLLGIFYAFDLYVCRTSPDIPQEEARLTAFNIRGSWNFLLLLGVVLTVGLSGLWRDSPSVGFYGVTLVEVLRAGCLCLLTYLSLRLTPKLVHHYNHFSWEPFREVAEVFFGIFITMIPVIVMLGQGVDGPFAALIKLADPHVDSALYFWITGVLSAFLDNAPTYLVFFHMAGGDAVHLMGPLNDTLIALSTGTVFMGASTYIANAPNFMVRTMAVRAGVKMPSFFGYMGWALLILIPIFYFMTWVIF